MMTTASEIWFSDDPRLTPAMRERGRSDILIPTPTKGPKGWIATANVELRER
jgi:hypothetical protein